MTIYSNVFPTHDQPYRLFPLRHNWNTPFRTNYEFKTDIIVSGNGKEQRRAVRYEPRASFEFTCNYKDNEKYLFDRFMDQDPKKLCWVAEECKTAFTSIAMDEDETSVKFRGGRPEWMPVNPAGLNVILQYEGQTETRVVQACSDNVMTFTEHNKSVWPAGTRIMAGALARVRPDPTSGRLTNRAGTVNVAFDMNPSFATFTPGVGDQTFLGFREIIPWEINWGANPEVTHAWPRDDVDYGYGMIQTFTPINFPGRINKFSYWRKGWQNSYNMIDFFFRMKGRNREFFAPGYERAIPYYAAAQGNKSILIKGLDFAYTYMGSTVYRRVAIRLKDGSLIHRQVDFIEALPDTNTSVIWLTEDLPEVPVAPAETNGIWWVTVSRFASDILTVDWLTDDIAQITFNLQNLENYDV